MPWTAKCEIIGYENPTGIYCSDCWVGIPCKNGDEIVILTASEAAEHSNTIICDNCGMAVWE